MKKVSVIIPCFNAIKWLPKCFLSLIEQSIGIDSLELIFIDDASTDEGQTWKMLQEFENAFPQSIVIIHLSQNMRQGGARNIGMSYATGKYIAFVDADDFVRKDFLANVYQKAVDTDADIVQFGYYVYSEKRGIISKMNNGSIDSIRIESDQQRKDFLVSEKISYGCWNKLYRRNLVECASAKYAEHVIYEEPLFVYPLLFWGNKFEILDESYYYYRLNDNGTMRKDMMDEKTLLMHADVQMKVWEYMKNTSFFNIYYEEIKLYFLHTFFFETLYFAKQRGFDVSMELYKILVDVVRKEVPDYMFSEYKELIPEQMKLYQLASKNISEAQLVEYLASLEKLIKKN